MATDPILGKLEGLLIAEIPQAVKRAQVVEPVYCLRIYYDATDMPEEGFATRLWLVKDAARTRLLKLQGKQAPGFIWCADEVDRTEDGYHATFAKDSQIPKLCQKFYPKLIEEENLQLYREALQRVAKQLNKLKWSDYCTVTDDFVVFPADGSHTFYDDFGDMTASVPAEKLKLLRSRKTLGAEDRWERL
jgi:hypothetical protein